MFPVNPASLKYKLKKFMQCTCRVLVLITYVDWGGSKGWWSCEEVPDEGVLSGNVELAFNTAFSIRNQSERSGK